MLLRLRLCFCIFWWKTVVRQVGCGGGFQNDVFDCFIGNVNCYDVDDELEQDWALAQTT